MMHCHVMTDGSVVYCATCWVALLCGVLVVYWPACSFRVWSWRGHTSLTKEETDQWCRLSLRIKYQSRAKWYTSIAICWGELVIYRVSHRLLYIVIIDSHVRRGDVIILQYWWYWNDAFAFVQLIKMFVCVLNHYSLHWLVVKRGLLYIYLTLSLVCHVKKNS